MLRSSTGEVVATLTKGLDGLAKRRKVRVVHGTARFTVAATTLAVETADGAETITFAHAIIAAGSQRRAASPGSRTTRASWTRPTRSSSRRCPSACW